MDLNQPQAFEAIPNPQGLTLYAEVFHPRPTMDWVIAIDHKSIGDYNEWFRELATLNQGWQDYLLSAILLDENPFSQRIQTQDWETFPAVLQSAVKQDLQLLQQAYCFSCDRLCALVQEHNPDVTVLPWADQLPDSGLSPAIVELRQQLEALTDWAEAVPLFADYYRQFGTGIFAQFHACRWDGSELAGIATPDPIALTDLVGYATQRDALVNNTQALLAGYSALNVLLYGTRGSGKSSLVKALLNEFADRGLRLIEVTKAHLSALPQIVEQLRDKPQKFIVFVDDLSFEEDDDAFKALKVVLEGGITARPANVVVYATSNRRHLIREFYGDRPRPKDADEIHQWDTLQEKMSFSDRFGLTLTFEPAEQRTYLAMVRHLAQDLNISPSDLEYRALQWATQQNGRSGRSARQFVDYITAELALRPEVNATIKPLPEVAP
jgi:uncharacterized protein